MTVTLLLHPRAQHTADTHSGNTWGGKSELRSGQGEDGMAWTEAQLLRGSGGWGSRSRTCSQ